ncbi:glycoside hydrolase family 32 protein [Zasmidium cellare ATCC 36951]|uniref:Glycoside hydrolase family 32 protein n=1 Tax=Zasmidium cellare ATCC 36951 TaxID=1080233 RepID=A0A6A6CMP6_ZASCE|nr:glycoside hydrolase family 32 protein [Zasmidium cellare ATCC 36951]KAF2167019.1 glycoside hydrolase family 32 protein [Zasmidium cellare ATCC 36951]
MANLSCSNSSGELTPTSSLESSTAPSSPPAWNRPTPTFKQEQLSREERFSRWRPKYHLMAKEGWMNDPCAPGYDPATGLYHLSFQWNPNGTDWGDIAWGSATSPDMIHWNLRDQPCLSPETSYDNKGVFTGCFIKARDESITYVYTSVNHLPIHHTLPHTKGSESLSLAKSHDGGKTFEKIAGNPVLPSEPAGLDVTGWRDPYVSAWPSMAKFLGYNEDDTLFGIISGGIRDVTPTTFLYAIDANDLTQWQYLGPLANFGHNLRPSRWSGDLGKNWEVTNFTTVHDSNDSRIRRDFLIMGTEGCIPERRPSAADPASLNPSRPARGQLWMSGMLQKPSKPSNGPVNLTYSFGGHLDHGCLYAASSFHDPVSQKQIVWGWITEEDLCDDFRRAQGWSGVLSMPRELRIQTFRHVVGASASSLDSITSIERQIDDRGAYTIRTLAIQPYQPLTSALRNGPSVCRATLASTELNSGPFNPRFRAGDVQTTQWELDCVFKVSKRTQHLGLSIDHAGDYSRATTLLFDQASETFVINRPAFPILNSSEFINSEPERAPHTLFTTRDPVTGKVSTEYLHIRAWRDNSVLEVFVNGRTAITTRLYAAEETFGMRFFADDHIDGIVDVPSELVSATIWDNIGLT